MADENALLEQEAESLAPPPLETPPAEPPPPLVDTPAGDGIAPKASTFEKIKSATRGIFESHGFTFRQGPGRPRKDGAPKSNDVPLDMPDSARPSALAGNPPPSSKPRNAYFVQRIAKAFFKGLASLADKALFNAAFTASGDREEARKIVAETTATEQEADAFAEAADALCEMYNYDPRIVSLAFSCGTVAMVGGRYAVAIHGQAMQARKRTQAPLAGDPSKK